MLVGATAPYFAVVDRARDYRQEASCGGWMAQSSGGGAA